MIQTYDLTVCTKNWELSDHFKLGEFACVGSNLVIVDDSLLHVLELLREWARGQIDGGCTIHINSGYRTIEHNKEVGGEPNSFHLRGQAADIRVLKSDGHPVDTKIIYDAFDHGEITGNSYFGGLGLYPTWIHVDTRGSKARWKKGF